MASSVHPLASSAFSTSGSSGLYDRARPTYPPTALSRIFAALQSLPSSTNGLNVVELGAGTGIFSRLLLRPPVDVTTDVQVAKLVAVEPSVGMRDGFRAGMQKIAVPVGEMGPAGPEVAQVVDGSFDRIPVIDGWADAVIIAQAFHWSHGHYDTALSSIARVLRPGAPLILLWNLEDREEAGHPWVGPVRDVYEAHEQGTPQYRLMLWKAIFDMPEFTENFNMKYEYKRMKWTVPTTDDGVVERVLSKSYITALGAGEKEKVESGVRGVLKDTAKTWIDEDGGVFEYPYATDLYIIRRK
ncbi:hypothetical protein Dda_8891 [Drechslerella dactyloides]|uniref:Methyltransferase type 11 domain-containing protein n=1 Tax=Drechslerella dactyloides TaxID=74499 RepID=A0AAD6NEQ9_DREDA|nr:hypothetical protein Dda_8891 [Drechslerella dactyloides]